MFIIFGIKRLQKRMATVFAMCGLCSTPAAQVIIRISTWFSLFFVPVIPLGSKYISTCTLCGRSVKIDKAHAHQMVDAAQKMSAESTPPDAAQPVGMAQLPEVPASPTEQETSGHAD